MWHNTQHKPDVSPSHCLSLTVDGPTRPPLTPSITRLQWPAAWRSNGLALLPFAGLTNRLDPADCNSRHLGCHTKGAIVTNHSSTQSRPHPHSAMHTTRASLCCAPQYHEKCKKNMQRNTAPLKLFHTISASAGARYNLCRRRNTPPNLMRAGCISTLLCQEVIPCDPKRREG